VNTKTQSSPQNVVQENGKTYLIDKVDGKLEVKYGLPPEVKFCKRCVISNQRVAPSIMHKDTEDSKKETVGFDAEGVCNGCRAVENKDQIDWAEREHKLKQLLNEHRSRNGSWDVLIPGSGGKDSVYAAHVLRAKYNMNPLTVTWAPHMYTDVGWRNFQRWIHNGGVDNILFTPDGLTHRLLTKLAYTNLLHPFQPFIFGQRNYPARVAKEKGIKLMFYGEAAAEYGTKSREDLEAMMPIRYYTGNPNDENMFIGGVHIDQLTQDYGITRQKLASYLPITEDDVRESGIDCRYLGYYLKWIPQECYYYSVEHVGFEPNSERTDGTYTKYNSIDDKLDGFHYWTGFIKFGLGRCTHEVSQEIRHEHLDREEGVALINKYDGEFPKTFFKDVLEYVGMTEDEFLETADRFRSPHLWKKTNEGWVIRHKVT